MEKDLSGLGLIKKLSLERPQTGLYFAVKDEKDVAHIMASGNYVAKFENEIDAQYTALAVNNFSSVCEVLNEMKMAIELTNGKNSSIVEVQLNKINQALNNIKL